MLGHDKLSWLGRKGHLYAYFWVKSCVALSHIDNRQAVRPYRWPYSLVNDSQGKWKRVQLFWSVSSRVSRFFGTDEAAQEPKGGRRPHGHEESERHPWLPPFRCVVSSCPVHVQLATRLEAFLEDSPRSVMRRVSIAPCLLVVFLGDDCAWDTSTASRGLPFGSSGACSPVVPLYCPLQENKETRDSPRSENVVHDLSVEGQRNRGHSDGIFLCSSPCRLPRILATLVSPKGSPSHEPGLVVSWRTSSLSRSCCSRCLNSNPLFVKRRRAHH